MESMKPKLQEVVNGSLQTQEDLKEKSICMKASVSPKILNSRVSNGEKNRSKKFSHPIFMVNYYLIFPVLGETHLSPYLSYVL
jgi:hypothetical protein